MMAVHLKQKMINNKLIQFCTRSTEIASLPKVFFFEKHKIAVIPIGCRTVHVLSDETILVTVHCPLGIQDACISVEGSSTLYLLVLSPSGTISRTPLDSIFNFLNKAGGATSTVDDSIFDDLLQEDDGKECTGVVVTLKDEDIILHSPESKQFAILNDILVTAEEYHITVYRREVCSSSTGASFHKIAMHRIDNIPFNSTKVQQVVKLFFACPPGTSFRVRSPSTHCSVDRTLYVQVFGTNVSLLEIPVLLVGYATGHVYSIPLHRQTKDTPQQPQLICDLQQPVAALYGLNLSNVSNNTKVSDKLCVLGHHGKLTVVEASTVESRQWISKEFYLNGPVLCSVLALTTVIHSSGCQFVVTDLRQIESKETHSHLTSEAYNGGQTSSMIGYADISENSVEWLSLNKRGHLYRHRIPRTHTDAQNHPASHHGSLKDLLTGLSRSSDELIKAQQNIAQLDAVLSQLSLLGYIAATPHEEDCTDLTGAPLKLTASVEQENLGPNTVLGIRVRVVNQSAVKLSEGWTLAIVLSVDRQRRKASIENLSRAVPLACLAKGDHQDILIPLNHSQVDSIPLTLESFVTFAPKSTRGLVSEGKIVTIPLRRLTIDILHCLEASRPSQRVVLGGSGTNTDLLLVQLAKTRPCSMDQSETPTDGTFPLKAGQLTLKTLVQESKVQNNVGREGMSPEARLLHHLLEESHLTVSPEQSHTVVRCIPGGHQVALTVRKSAAQEGTLEVVWETDDLWTLSQLHTAITNKVEKLRDVQELLKSHAVISKSEEVGRQAVTLTDRIGEMNRHSSHFSRDISDLFIFLRNIP